MPADRIRLHRQVHDGPVLVTEGPSDVLILRPHLEGVTIFPVNGKSNVFSCLLALQHWKLTRFAGVTDRDFEGDGQAAAEIQDKHIHYMERDLENMLVKIGVLATVIEHLGSEEKLARLGGPQALIEKLVETIKPITRLRMKSRMSGWALAFDRVDLPGKLDQRTLELKVSSYCAALGRIEPCPASVTEMVSAASDEALDDGYGPRGRDLIMAAGVALRHVVGSHRQAAVSEQVLAAHVHSSSGLALARSDWLRELRALLDVA